ncbi:MAG TPA: metal ABC transporter permease [Candidatus Krumholzibacteria bacterium]|nr:metal ABC transporter permease [Candidatus Krumholzibacteria bacterium]HRX49855.1 metal ABC transporter permease [Candidatus Krumholzibacteria bacterium]
MSGALWEILAIAVLASVACALVGVFLVLRRLAMLSDAISHAILPGIVLAYFATKDLNSPWLVLAAAATGVLTVGAVEALARTRRLKEDAAMGIVFPALFSLGVVLITRFAGHVHLDVDSVLLGELAFAPFDRMILGGHDVGARGLWLMGGVALLNASAIAAFYKELKLATFDAGLAASLGLAPAVIHYGLMGLVSVTAVSAFDAVGLVLVVALMIGPAAAASLLTDRLAVMLLLAAGLGAVSAAGGFVLAWALDASIAGAMAVGVGVMFALVFLAAPRRGLLATLLRRRRQRLEFAAVMLAIHLAQHEGTADEDEESRVEHLQGSHVGWTPRFTARVVDFALDREWIGRDGGRLHLTEAGRNEAGRALSGLGRRFAADLGAGI